MIEFDIDKRTILEPKVGRLLISEPFMADVRFFRTVIFIANYDEEGTLGFVLNQRPDGNTRVLNAETNEPLFSSHILRKHLSQGGPINEEDFFILHDQGERLGGHKIIEGVHLGLGDGKMPSNQTLDDFILDNHKDVQFKFFLGSSGWTVGQLEAELEIGSWFVAEFNKDIVFSTDYDEMWKQAIYTLGEEFAYFATLPLHPQLN